MSKDIVYAIDFGTSNSLLAASVEGKPIAPIPLDPEDKDPQILRTLMYFPRQGQPSFGKTAISQYSQGAGEGRLIRSIKKHLPSSLFRGTDINGQFYKLEDLVGSFLRETKRRADEYFGQDVESVVLGRPAKFSLNDENDKLAEDRLKSAAFNAGFRTVDFFPEPLAAAFDFRSHIQNEKIILIVDLGGGTSDFTVIRLRPNDFKDDDVLSIGGISIAGDALDGSYMAEKIAPHFGSQVEYRFPMSHNILRMPASLKYQLMSPADIVLLQQKDLMQFLKEVRKCTFSERDSARLDQLFALVADNLGFALYEEIDRSKREVCTKGSSLFSFHEDNVYVDDSVTLPEFEMFTLEDVHKIFQTMDAVVKNAGVAYEEIDFICCTGGTSKIPAVKKELESRFGSKRLTDLNSFQSVIQGLARRASELT